MKVEFEPAAEQEIGEAIHRYFVEAGLPHAIGFDNEVKRLVDLLLSRPNLGTPGLKETRSIPLQRYPYSLHYRVEGSILHVFAVAHHSRRPGYWRKRI